MPQFIELNSVDQRSLILKSSKGRGISPVLIEKDFWVCFILENLFSLDFSSHLIFKGGTSLSKVYNLISRFSEDSDVTMDKCLFLDEPIDSETSRKRFEKLIDLTNLKAVEFIKNTVVPALSQKVSSYLTTQSSWYFEIDQEEPKNVRFYYPSLFDPNDVPYIRKSVLIEFGIRGAIYPFEVRNVRSYIEDDSAEILEIQDIKIRTLAPERTFWEKITLLHAENHRPENKNMGDRTSRHYYDVFKLLQSDVKQQALSNLELLKDVIINKSKYFRSSWAHYDTAIPGSLNIVPNRTLKNNLERDYDNMRPMIYGDIPEFGLVLKEIEKFQNDFNKLKWG